MTELAAHASDHRPRVHPLVPVEHVTKERRIAARHGDRAVHAGKDVLQVARSQRLARGLKRIERHRLTPVDGPVQQPLHSLEVEALHDDRSKQVLRSVRLEPQGVHESRHELVRPELVADAEDGLVHPVGETLVATGDGNVPRGDEAAGGVAGGDAAGLDPELPGPIGKRGDLVPVAAQHERVQPPGDQMQRPPRHLARLDQPEPRAGHANRLVEVAKTDGRPGGHAVGVHPLRELEAVAEQQSGERGLARPPPVASLLRGRAQGV